MGTRKREFRPSTYERLVHAASDRMSEGALRELEKWREIKARGGSPEVEQNGHGDFHVYDWMERVRNSPRR
jgi:hypothetical protein